MKRIIAAVSFAVLAIPALAQTGKPYEQLDVDRALPDIRVERSQLAAAGATRSDREITVVDTRSPFATDHNFIAPAQ